jgi:hypothetical protein
VATNRQHGRERCRRAGLRDRNPLSEQQGVRPENEAARLREGRRPEIWYLDPEDQTAEVLNLGGDGLYVVTAKLSGDAPIVSKALPGLFLTLGQVFAATP